MIFYQPSVQKNLHFVQNVYKLHLLTDYLFKKLFIMKTFISTLLMAIVALSFGACTKFQDTGSEYGRQYVIKKIDGKELWGVAYEDDAKLVFRLGQYHYGKLKTYKEEWQQRGIKCQYDKIDFQKIGGGSYMFIGHKDGQLFYYNENCEAFADNHPVTKVEFIGSGKGLCFGNYWEYKFYTPAGVYSTVTGPYEDINVGYFGYSIKEGGKWGYVYGRTDIKNDPYFKQTVPCEYDEIIEVIAGNFTKNQAFARKGDVWTAYDNRGNVTKMDQALLRKAKSKKDKATNLPFYTFYYDYRKY